MLHFVLDCQNFISIFVIIAEEVRPTRATRASARRGKRTTPARGPKTRRGRSAATSDTSVSYCCILLLSSWLIS